MAVKDTFKEFFVEQEVTVRKRINTVPNMITFTGILLTVLYAVMYIAGFMTWAIPVVVIAVVLSDLFDGLAARKLDQHTVLGKSLDPLRDRLIEFAVIGNMLWIDFSFLTGLFTFLILFIEYSIYEVKKGIKSNNNSGGFVHTAGKARLAVQMLCAGVFIVSTYWASLWNTIIPRGLNIVFSVEILLFTMLLASYAAFTVYWIKFKESASH